MHDREIVLIAAAALVVGGLVWLTLAAARAASRADRVAETATPAPTPVPDHEFWDIVRHLDDIPVYDWESDGL